MKSATRFGSVWALALGLAACGSNTESSTDVASAALPDSGVRPDAAMTLSDTAVPTVDVSLAVDKGVAVDVGTAIDTGGPEPYIWVVVQDTEQKACTTNGPGADIDAVALLAAGGPIGWGKIGKAVYVPNPLGNACENTDCAGGNCKYAAISKTLELATLVAGTEGPANAKVNETGDDIGYLSLNAGTLQIQIGDLTGMGPAKAIKSGDMIKVYEVDKTYIASGSAPTDCKCVPEKYTVSLQTASGATLPLKPATLAAENVGATLCGALTATSTEGCGSTVFVVP